MICRSSYGSFNTEKFVVGLVGLGGLGISRAMSAWILGIISLVIVLGGKDNR